jgi:hypothetical protein
LTTSEYVRANSHVSGFDSTQYDSMYGVIKTKPNAPFHDEYAITHWCDVCNPHIAFGIPWIPRTHKSAKTASIMLIVKHVPTDKSRFINATATTDDAIFNVLKTVRAVEVFDLHPPTRHVFIITTGNMTQSHEKSFIRANVAEKETAKKTNTSTIILGPQQKIYTSIFCRLMNNTSSGILWNAVCCFVTNNVAMLCMDQPQCVFFFNFFKIL